MHDDSPPIRASARQRRFFLSVLLAVSIAGPLAVAVVAVLWARGEPAVLLRTASSPALWSARTFIAVFDALVVATWPLAILVVSRRGKGHAVHG